MSGASFLEDIIPVVEFMYRAFIRMPGESYRTYPCTCHHGGGGGGGGGEGSEI